MLSLEPEVDALASAAAIDEPARTRLVALERREVFSLYDELRILLYLGVMLVVGAVGTYVARNYNRIGPIALTFVIFTLAIGCLAFAEARRRHWRGWTVTLADDYILLAGSLLLGIGAGFAETQFHIFGEAWKWHLLILATVYAAIAYRFDSRIVLSLSITSLAAWFGIDRDVDRLFSEGVTYGAKALTFAAVLGAWRVIHARLNGVRTFVPLLEHYAANLALIGSLILVFEHETHWGGVALAFLLAGGSIAIGFHQRREAFVFYGLLYGWIALSSVVVEDLLNEEALIFFYFIVSTIALVIAIYRIHRRFGEAA
jgi:hypothetical protein